MREQFVHTQRAFGSKDDSSESTVADYPMRESLIFVGLFSQFPSLFAFYYYGDDSIGLFDYCQLFDVGQNLAYFWEILRPPEIDLGSTQAFKLLEHGSLGRTDAASVGL